MEIKYKTNKLKKVCTDAKYAEKLYGSSMMEKIDQRIGEISAADNVGILIKYGLGRCHPLHGDRNGQYAVDLVNPFRMIFEVCGDVIEIARILDITDYH